MDQLTKKRGKKSKSFRVGERAESDHLSLKISIEKEIIKIEKKKKNPRITEIIKKVWDKNW